MKTTLVTHSLNSTAIACRVFVRGLGYRQAVLRKQHHTGYITLATAFGEFDIERGETRFTESGIPITELVSSEGIRFYAWGEHGDVWAMIHEIQDVPAFASPEVEIIHAQIA